MPNASLEDLLCVAVLAGDTTTVQSLLLRGVSPHGADSRGIPLLVLAAHGGHTGIVYNLLDAGVAADTAFKGWSALFAAIHGGWDDITRLLLAFGADPDARDLHGQTPLMAAAKRLWATEAVRILIAAGAQIDARTTDGRSRTALSDALEHEHWAAVSLLMAPEDAAATPFLSPQTTQTSNSLPATEVPPQPNPEESRPASFAQETSSRISRHEDEHA